jgi:hypothetical protein
VVAVGSKQKAVGSTKNGSAAIAAGPFCFGSAELFLNSAACILGTVEEPQSYKSTLRYPLYPFVENHGFAHIAKSAMYAPPAVMTSGPEPW